MCVWSCFWPPVSLYIPQPHGIPVAHPMNICLHVIIVEPECPGRWPLCCAYRAVRPPQWGWFIWELTRRWHESSIGAQRSGIFGVGVSGRAGEGGVSDGGGLGWRVESVWLSLPLTYSCSLASAVCPILLLTPFRVETQTGFCYVVQQCRGLQPYDCV